MKFTQLFNWLRFKLITPFQAMRNRFFIERDSKHRRMLTNFGFTFRNSKWSSYAQTNLSTKHNHTTSCSKILFQMISSCIFAFLCLYLLVYFNLTHHFSGGEMIVSFVELIRTSTWYSIGVFFTSLSGCLNATVNQYLSELLRVRTPVLVPVETNKTDEDEDEDELTDSCATAIQFKNMKDRGKVENPYSCRNVEKHIKRTISSMELMYTISNIARATSPSQYKPIPVFNLPYDFAASKLLKNNWTLLTTQAEQLRNETKSTTGLFTAYNETFNNINISISKKPQTQNLAFLHLNYLQNIKIDRWLYRYSLIHRNSLHKAHDLTLTKQLTSMGFFSGNLTSNNLWASNLVSLTPHLRTTLTSLHRQMYGDVWSNLGTNPTPLTDIAFFESSYFWVLKRFYNMNTLNRNCIISTVNLRSEEELLSLKKVSTVLNNSDLLVRANIADLSLFATTNMLPYRLVKVWPNNACLDTDIITSYHFFTVVGGDVAEVGKLLTEDRVNSQSQSLNFNLNKCVLSEMYKLGYGTKFNFGVNSTQTLPLYRQN